MDIQAVTAFVGVLIGGGILTFVEFMIKRHDEKKSRKSGVLKAISDLDKKVDERFDTLNAKISEVDEKVDERSAVSARVRILRFADEMMEGRKHSRDSYEQCLEDIDYYELYCFGDGEEHKGHPNFKNNKTVSTVEYIKNNYAERLEKHDFL